jgi:hypothetical protein
MKIPAFLRGLAAYLSDWKNLLSHALVGIALVAVPLILPLPPAGRIGVFAAIVCLNLLRTRWDKKRKLRKAAHEDAREFERASL